MADTKISALTAIAALTDTDLLVMVDDIGGTPTTKSITVANAKTSLLANQAELFVIAIGDETTALTTGVAKVTFRAPFACTHTAIPRLSLTTASSSGLPTIDVNEAGVTMLSTKLTCDANEKTSTTAAAAAVMSDTSWADDAEITIDIDVAGTGAAGAKVTFYVTRA